MRQLVANLPLIVDERLARHTSWRVGGPARYYLETSDAALLQAALAWAQTEALPTFLLGGGTNLLVRDTGFPGLVLRYTARTWQLEGAGEQALLRVDAGAPLAGTARRLCTQGWAGLEWAEGLPGTVGGAVFGNAGCYGGDLAHGLNRAWLLAAGNTVVWSCAQLGYGYRTSVLKQARGTSNQPIILAAEIRLVRADPRELAAIIERTAAERKAKTPLGRSCGSVFQNPPGQSAGRLIEAAGLKGHRVGAAEISPRHANYIVNHGGASSDDLLALIEIVRSEVLRQFGIELALEVQVL